MQYEIFNFLPKIMEFGKTHVTDNVVHFYDDYECARSLIT